jgi:hypothetical protein
MFDPAAGSDKIAVGKASGKLRLDGKMRWFRDNIGQGAWLALLALVINLGLSFGHVHAIEASRTERGLIALVAAANPHHGKTQGHPEDGQADYLCPICTAAAAMASPLASPPMLHIEFASVTIDRGIEGVVAAAEPRTAAFQSRGPPIS